MEMSIAKAMLFSYHGEAHLRPHANFFKKVQDSG